MLNKVDFIIVNILLPITLSILYSHKIEKNGINYIVTKGVWYLGYAIAVAIDYLVYDMNRYVVGFTVTIAIMEGLPLILKPILHGRKGL